MSAQPLQERILAAIREYQPVKEADLVNCLPGIDPVLIDTGIRALMRANRVSLSHGRYDLVVERERPQMQKKPVAQAVVVAPTKMESIDLSASVAKLQPSPTVPDRCSRDELALLGEFGEERPPTAEEELAANVMPDGSAKLFPCERCEEPLPTSAYRHSSLGKRFKVCKRCDAELRGFVSRKTPIPPRSEVIEPVPAIVERNSDPIISKLRAQLGELTRSIREHEEKARQLRQEANEQEQLVSAKRIALDELNAVIAQLQKLVPEAFT